MITSYEDYDLIQDILYTTYSGLILKVNTKLFRPSPSSDSGVKHFHSEIRRDVSIGSVRRNSIMVKREIDTFLSLSIIDRANAVNEYVYIFPKDMLATIGIIQDVTRSLTDSKIWKIDEKTGEMRISPNSKKEWPLLLGDRILSFKLVVMIDRFNKFSQGVKLSINDDVKSIICSVEEFMGFSYYMQTINLYTAAQNMINYVPKPTPGQNILSFTASPEEVERAGDMNIIMQQVEATNKVSSKSITKQLERSRGKTSLDDMLN